MRITSTYTIEVLTHLKDLDLVDFFLEEGHKVSEMYGFTFDPYNFNFERYSKLNGTFLVVRKNGVPKGCLLYRLFESAFDDKVRILYQDLLYVKPGNSRVTKILMQHLIDFGRVHADHVITCIAAKTNIKSRSLEKLGFEKLEELYRMRFDHE